MNQTKQNKNRYKEVIYILLFFTVLSLLIFTDFLGDFKKYVPLLWIIGIILGIVQSLDYRFGNRENKVRFSSQNDGYTKITVLILAILCIIGGAVMLYYNFEKVFSVLIIISGTLLLVSRVLFVPMQIIELKNDKLIFQTEKGRKKIAVDLLDNTDISENQITISDTEGNRFYIEHLNLTESEMNQVQSFVYKTINKLPLEA